MLSPVSPSRSPSPELMVTTVINGGVGTVDFEKSSILEQLDKSTQPYKKETTEGSSLWHLKTAKTDYARLGRPDALDIAGREVVGPPSPRTFSEIVSNLHALGEGSDEKTNELMQVASFRTKADAVSKLMEAFQEDTGLAPILGREGGFTKSDISLSKDGSSAACTIEGAIKHATDDNSDIVPVDYAYRVEATYSLNKTDPTVRYDVRFDVPIKDDWEKVD